MTCGLTQPFSTLAGMEETVGEGHGFMRFLVSCRKHNRVALQNVWRRDHLSEETSWEKLSLHPALLPAPSQTIHRRGCRLRGPSGQPSLRTNHASAMRRQVAESTRLRRSSTDAVIPSRSIANAQNEGVQDHQRGGELDRWRLGELKTTGEEPLVPQRVTTMPTGQICNHGQRCRCVPIVLTLPFAHTISIAGRSSAMLETIAAPGLKCSHEGEEGRQAGKEDRRERTRVGGQERWWEQELQSCHSISRTGRRSADPVGGVESGGRNDDSVNGALAWRERQMGKMMCGYKGMRVRGNM